MSKLLVFDIWGKYAHFKKIFATTSALSYAIPSKTALYGIVGAIIGLEKFDNLYLNSFAPDSCKIGVQIIRPIVMQRINTNLHPHINGLIGTNQNRKPTTVEYVYQPHYRIYFSHSDHTIHQKLKTHLQNHTAVYTPTLGLANLLSNLKFIGEFETTKEQGPENKSVEINSVIPRQAFLNFDTKSLIGNEIIEYSQFAVEMNSNREVTKRDDVFMDRNGKTISAFVKYYSSFKLEKSKQNVILF